MFIVLENEIFTIILSQNYDFLTLTILSIFWSSATLKTCFSVEVKGCHMYEKIKLISVYFQCTDTLTNIQAKLTSAVTGKKKINKVFDRRKYIYL